GAGVVSWKTTAPVLAFTRVKRLKNIFWKTFNDPAAKGSAPHVAPGTTTTRSIVKPSGRFRPSTPFRSIEGPPARMVARPTTVSGTVPALSVRSTSHKLYV